MRYAIVTAILAAFSTAAGMAAQDKAPTASRKDNGMTTLSGCVAPEAKSKKGFTIEDAEQGQVYKLTGTDVRDYVGQHVEIVGAPSRGLVIVGGLYPSPNVAGQTGGIDPVKAAIAAQSGPTANAPRPLVEFKVRSVRITPGDCPKD